MQSKRLGFTSSLEESNSAHKAQHRDDKDHRMHVNGIDPHRKPCHERKVRPRYFFSSVVTDGGGAVAVGAAGVAAGGCGGGSPRMPSLNSRTPCPRPFIISGIFFPPKRTSTTAAMIKRCIGLSNIETYLSHPADRARHPKPTISGACRTSLNLAARPPNAPNPSSTAIV